ncbi:metal-dependent phosphohydrolase [Acidithiobacillus ferrooxidans]|uniref:HD/PDEase domain-containing protein n=1 Tax=Acidithiobacillus ferrooxidans (strain ATCC 23270 / DSM 14882 / CIP 104768 / NCIMB 8455) TaxID=243159 RepID=B7J8T6_ACIF2|nr:MULTISPECIES: hypothetical protein [Acidithiobacillus]ACK78118.1 hypothetical protein AFE_1254 [Acidithiobacillus ferrooxidans ATCC 23270]MBN6745198.1 metal-dependent phosphohydrolase [Acidithiobacillus sp. MC2.2]MBN6748041.1 metal-dependent phosphohydrolase [Acidithiobacillus sp. PG05]
MIAAPHRRLVSALIIITSFWMMVGTLVFIYRHNLFQDGGLLIILLFHTLGRLAWVAAFLLASAGLALLIRAADIFRVAIGLRPEMYRGALTTIGVLPQPALPEGYDHTEQDQNLWTILSAWKEKEKLDIKAVSAFAKENTPAARLFWSVFHILKAADLPASPRPGEHGNASLLEHSLRVSAALAWVWRDDARIALEQSQVRVAGLPTEVGRPMRTEPYPLEIAILAGICHDIGKIACFRRDKEGVITVVGLHDMVGSRILGLLPALWDLRDEQGNPDTFLQHLLTQSIRYYHHPGAFPLSGFKRELLTPDPAIKQLMGDIHRADLIAGGLEGRAEEVAQDYLEEDELEEQSLDAQIWDAFLFLLEDESRINSPSPARRLAYKKGPILYLIEPKIRERICDHLSITRHDYATPNNGNPGKIIQIIASRLDAMGLLIKTVGKVSVVKPEGAAVQLRFESTKKNADGDATEHTDTKIPHYVVRITPESVFAPLLALDNYPAELSVPGLFWPQYAPKKTSAQIPDAGSAPAGAQPEGEVPDIGSGRTEEPAEVEEENTATIQSSSPVEEGEGEDEEEDEETSSPNRTTEYPDEDDPFADASETPAAPEPKGAEASAAPAQSAGIKTTIASRPSTRGTPSSQQTSKPSLTEAQKAEKKAQLDRAKSLSSHAEHKTKLIDREAMTPNQRAKHLRNRADECLATFPNIVKVMAGVTLDDSERLRLISALIWIDETRRARITASPEINPTAIIRVALSTIFNFPLSKGMDTVTYEIFTLILRKSGIRPGDIWNSHISELRMFLAFRVILVDGLPELDIENSIISAPINGIDDLVLAIPMPGTD